MFKRLKQFFIKTPHEKAIQDMIDINAKYGHPLDWVNDGKPLDKECYYMVKEPVLTLLDSLKARPNRFKIYKMSNKEYVESRRHELDTYGWMKHGCLFYKFVDKVSGISHTAVITNGKIYRVDDLPFTLNHWELTVLLKGFIVARKPSEDRIVQRRRNRQEAQRKAADEAEMIARHIYMESLK